mmetsp:Transcript_33628/g.96995  ORF Transcript_33628/g.96995 Transcript_33628/m.96995 type:complete len:256 (-) Transcript_33628:311-1078(-)
MISSSRHRGVKRKMNTCSGRHSGSGACRNAPQFPRLPLASSWVTKPLSCKRSVRTPQHTNIPTGIHMHPSIHVSLSCLKRKLSLSRYRQTDRRPSYYAHTGMYAGVCVCREGAPRPVHEPTGPSSPAVQCACVFHVDESDLDVPLGLAQPMHTRRHYHPAYLSDPHAEDGLPLPGEIQVTHHHRPALLVDHLVALEVVVPDGVVDLDGLVEVEREGPLAHLHYLEAHTQHRCLRLSDEGQIVLVSRGQLVGDRRR